MKSSSEFTFVVVLIVERTIMVHGVHFQTCFVAISPSRLTFFTVFIFRYRHSDTEYNVLSTVLAHPSTLLWYFFANHDRFSN